MEFRPRMKEIDIRDRRPQRDETRLDYKPRRDVAQLRILAAKMSNSRRVLLRADRPSELPDRLAARRCPVPARYLPTRIRAPATIANTAISVPEPLNPKFNSGIAPVRISHTPNNNIPILLVSFIASLQRSCRRRKIRATGPAF
jgi:hypothetical protein